jgi:predicted ATPase
MNYDRGVKLFVAAATAPGGIYQARSSASSFAAV